MKRDWREVVLCVRTLVAPSAMCAAVMAEPRTTLAIACIGAIEALNLLLQSFALWPAFAGDPLILDAPGGVRAALRGFCIARGVAIALAPAAVAVRATALGALLYVSCGRQRRLPAPGAVVALAAYAEMIPWIESAALTIAIAIAAPRDLNALRAIQLRAGLDLVWQQPAAAWTPWLAAVNAFTVWWAGVVAFGLVRMAGLSRLRGVCTALVLVVGRAAIDVACTQF